MLLRELALYYFVFRFSNEIPEQGTELEIDVDNIRLCIFVSRNIWYVILCTATTVESSVFNYNFSAISISSLSIGVGGMVDLERCVAYMLCISSYNGLTHILGSSRYVPPRFTRTDILQAIWFAEWMSHKWHVPLNEVALVWSISLDIILPVGFNFI